MAGKFDRLSELRKYIDKSQAGIEVAPYCTPIAPRSDGYRTIVMDVFDTDTIRERAAKDVTIEKEKIALIEDVDVIGDASDIVALSEAVRAEHPINYIVSSHNFEHLPNPIKFLAGCAEILQDGGVLSMAIPDYRTCFDHFRYPTNLAEWLDAYHRPTDMPSPARIFEAFSVYAEYAEGDTRHLAFNFDQAEPRKFRSQVDLKSLYQTYVSRLDGSFDYVDSHFSAMFDKTFELMICDLIWLEILDFEILEISPTRGHEFFVHLRKPLKPTAAIDQYQDVRMKLLHEIQFGLGAQAFKTVRARQVFRLSDLSVYSFFNPKHLARRLMGEAFFTRLRVMNAARKNRQR
ncbi:adenine phosphoribosyltransferase [Roseobacter sp. EG26]|uniref:methyltransferase domain-containing protein n=1 Tax=Roseobacter sp. EG26 TaxID=3412477 RepID=UPI003CE527F3